MLATGTRSACAMSSHVEQTKTEWEVAKIASFGETAAW